MRTCQVHNVRFYRPKPEVITCMSVLKGNELLAVSRFDASIEIWNIKDKCFLERRIPSSSENSSIEGIAWCQHKLFTVGLHGLLIEYDISELCQKNIITVTGGPAYCLDVNRDESAIAVGTEHGYLNLFSVTGDSVIFNKFLDKQEGSIICLKYDPSGKYIASGGADAIRIWDVVTGHAIHKMSTGRSEANKETMVWCLAVLSDMTVISGDSRGKLTFWDGNLGAQIESYQSHRADILALCLSEDEDALFCAGADPTIVHYARISVKEEKKFVKSIQRLLHDHDVRALSIKNGKLYSGGTDSYLGCSYFPPRTLLRFPYVLQYPSMVLAKEARLIMLRYSNSVEVWTLGSSTKTDKAKVGLLPVDKQPKKLIVLQKEYKTDTGKNRRQGIHCCAISDNGKYLLYSWDSGKKLLQLHYEEDTTPSLQALDNFECNTPCHQAIFSPNNKQLIIVSSKRQILIFTLNETSVEGRQDLNIDKDVQDTVTHLVMSTCGEYLVVADARSNIVVYTLKDNKLSKYCTLPKYTSGPTVLSIQPSTLNLVVAYADNKLVEYDLQNRKFTKFTRYFNDYYLSSKWLTKTKNYPFRSITFDPKNPDLLIVHDDNNIIILNKKMSANSDPKVPKLDKSEEPKQRLKYELHELKKYKHLVHLDWISDDEMVAVEVTPLSILEQLPPCLVKKKFGKK